MIYADCSASTPTLPCAIEAFIHAPSGNPDSIHAAGRAAKESLETSRRIVAECINAEPDEIYFCSGGTEANNIVIRSMEEKCLVRTSLDSHVSALLRRGTASDTEKTAMSLPYVNNETGVIENPQKIRAENPKVSLIHYDCVAAVGQTEVDVKKLDCDYITAAGHKFGAPQGIGFIYARHGAPLTPMLYGGKQEGSIRPGTPSVALAAAMAAALKYRTENLQESTEKLWFRNRFLLNYTRECIEKVYNNAVLHQWNTVPYIMSYQTVDVPSTALLTLLDAQGVCCSAGSACSAQDREPSHVLLNAGLSVKEASETIRISICPETTLTDMDNIAVALRKSVEKYRSIMK